MQKNRLRLFVVLMLLILLLGLAGLSVVKKNIVNEKAEYVLDGSKVLKYGNTIYFEEQGFESLSALSITGNLTWRFFPQGDDFIVDFTQAGSTVYILTNAHLYFLSTQGAILNRMSIKNLLNKNATEIWSAIAWSHGDYAYVLLDTNLFEFQGLNLIKKYNMTLPDWPNDERKFGEDTLLVYRNASKLDLYDLNGSKIEWHIKETGYIGYVIHYPYLLLFSTHKIAFIKNGKSVWSHNFGISWVKGIIMGNKSFMIMLGSTYKAIDFTVRKYNYDFRETEHFYINTKINQFNNTFFDGKFYVFNGRMENGDVWAICNDYMLNFHIPLKNGSALEATIYPVEPQFPFSRILETNKNILISAGYYDDGWAEGGSLDVYTVQKEYTINPYANAIYKLVFVIGIIAITGVGIIWLRKKQ